MIRQYIVPTNDPSALPQFVHSLVADLKNSNSLKSDGIVLKEGDLEMVIGSSSSSAFNDRSLVNELALSLTPIIYEFVEFLSPEIRYNSSVGEIAPGTTLWRLIHNDNQTRKPLFAMNAIHIHADGYWHDIDMTQSQVICPTLEVMGLKTGQTINLQGKQFPLDNLNLRTVNMFEFTRLGSMMEMVTGRERKNTRPPDPIVDEFMRIVKGYRDNQEAFLQLMLRGRTLITLGFLIYLLAVDNNLMFGHSEKKLLERFLETLGVSPVHLQWLERSIYHMTSSAYQLNQPHYERHEGLPFLIEFNDSVHDSLLKHLIQSCEVMA